MLITKGLRAISDDLCKVNNAVFHGEFTGISLR